ncbi:MAG TPA: histone deacetylase [Thermoanaerobaculia bacterium]|nr:histone deacetylase [Thermoanaerobaculia bacterium]
MRPVLQAFTSPKCSRHAPGGGFPERKERLDVVLRALRSAEVTIEEVSAQPGALEAIEALHEREYVERFRRAVARGDGLFDSADNPIVAGSWDAALGAVEAALAAADWLVAGTSRVAFAAVRPPGHHAERDLAMGFCFFGNAAVAAQYLIDRHGFARPALFDFDVHHGNGTQHLFEDRADVLYASTHQFPFYPGSGAASERGRGDGLGTTLNVPLPAGSGDAVHLEAIEKRVLPALAAFEPDVLVLSAGFDSWQGDPLGGMTVTREGFAEWGRRLGRFARRHCDGRALVLLEGGYDLEELGDLVVAHLQGLEEGMAGSG